MPRRTCEVLAPARRESPHGRNTRDSAIGQTTIIRMGRDTGATLAEPVARVAPATRA